MTAREHGPTDGLGDTELQNMTLESLRSAVRYHAWLRSLAQPFLGDHPIEVGSGLGDYAAAFLDEGVRELTVSEVEPQRVAWLRRRFDGDARVHVLALDLLAAPVAAHSSLIAFNVLEHINDDIAALRGAGRLVRPGGLVVMVVPAFASAMSEFDVAVGHIRRYRKASLAAAVERAGLHVETIHYLNAPGLVAWYLGMKLLRLVPQDGLTVRIWDRVVVPIARRVESRWQPPFGQSVFVAARVPHAPQECARALGGS